MTTTVPLITGAPRDTLKELFCHMLTSLFSQKWETCHGIVSTDLNITGSDYRSQLFVHG